MLALQMIKIMDKIWLKEGLDLRMVIFKCLSTGRDRGKSVSSVLVSYYFFSVNLAHSVLMLNIMISVVSYFNFVLLY